MIIAIIRIGTRTGASRLTTPVISDRISPMTTITPTIIRAFFHHVSTWYTFIFLQLFSTFVNFHRFLNKYKSDFLSKITTPYPVLCFYFVIFKKRQNRHLPELAFLNPRAYYTPILFFYHFMNYFPRLSLFYHPASQGVS